MDDDGLPQRGGSRRGVGWRGLGVLFLVALALRLAAIAALNSPGAAEGKTPWDWGWEAACMARTLLDGEPFGDTWGHGSGASGWLTPVYPGILALCMKLGGGVTALAAWFLFGAHALLSAATCVALVFLGRALAAPRTALIAGWVFAFWPASIWNAVTFPWDTTLVAFAITAYLALLVRQGPAMDLRKSALCGAAFGGVLWINPAPLALLPGVLFFACFEAGAMARTLRRASVLLLACVACVAPWMLRNALVIGSPGLRTNFGVELRVGNNDRANGRYQTSYHPSHTPGEFARYAELGERDYVRWAGGEAREWIAAHPARFLSLCLRRLTVFWLGEPPFLDPRTSGQLTAAQDPKAWIKWAFHCASGFLGLFALARFRRGDRSGRLLRWAVPLFSAPYAITHVMERYRFPLDPVLVLLAVWFALQFFGEDETPT